MKRNALAPASISQQGSRYTKEYSYALFGVGAMRMTNTAASTAICITGCLTLHEGIAAPMPIIRKLA